MDLLACGTLTALELGLINIFRPALLSRFFAPSNGMVTAVFLAHYVVVKIYRIFLYPHFFSPFRHLPGPKDGHFLFGQTFKMTNHELPSGLYIEWMRQNPDAHFIRYLGFMNQEVLVANSLATTKNILQTNCYSFEKPRWFLRLAKEIAGHGILFMEGNEHRAHRRMLTNPFALKSIRKLEPVFKEKAKDICVFLDQEIAKNGGATCEIEALDLFMRAILDIVGQAFLGINLDHINPYKDPSNEKQAHSADGCSFPDAYDHFFAPKGMSKFLLYANAYFPTRWIPLKANREYLRSMDWLNGEILGHIRARYRAVAEAKEAGTWDPESTETRDLLTMIADESGPGGAAEGLGENDLKGHLLQLMAAGHDTSANMLGWTALVLSTRHDIQDALRKELMTVPEDASFADLDRLPYLEGVVKESLRLYSPAVKVHRVPNEDMDIEGVRIPKGTEIELVPSVGLLNPLVWGDDVDEYDPTRWQRLKGAQTSPYAFTAFSNGPRVCLGKLFATFELKLILAALVRNFRFLEVTRPPVVENPAFTLRPYGMKVRLERVKGV